MLSGYSITRAMQHNVNHDGWDIMFMQCVCTAPLAGNRMPDSVDSIWLVHRWHLTIVGNAYSYSQFFF